jgi:hypothetical protein
MNAMSFTSTLGRQGANFTTFFAHTPVCCPSRSELLAGRYFHNLKNSGWAHGGGCMGINSTVNTPSGDAPAFATALQAAGYATGLFGKHYNSGGMRKICPEPVGDGSMVVPEGWLEYLGACPDTCYFNCTCHLCCRLANPACLFLAGLVSTVTMGELPPFLLYLVSHHGFNLMSERNSPIVTVD